LNDLYQFSIAICGAKLMAIVAYFILLGSAFGAAMVLYFGLRAVKLI
jgi:Cytochrome B6-F complex subunit VI (PetL)